MDEERQSGQDGLARDPQRRRVGLAVGALVLVLVGGLLLVVGIGRQEPAPPGRPDAGGGPSSASGRTTAPSQEDGTGERAARRPLPPSDPVRVSIPSIKVSSSLEDLGLDEQKAMETPRDPAKAGWYRPGPTPGARGPAVIAGHVTWNGTPSVFFRLAKLKKGDTIGVRREDGVTAQFTVDRVAQYPKDRFPTVEVYRNLDHAGLRLITCAGDYSKADRRYSDNIIVYATLTGSGRTSTPH
ncbi:class F sortase [Streptomyces sp. NPDC055239]